MLEETPCTCCGRRTKYKRVDLMRATVQKVVGVK